MSHKGVSQRELDDDEQEMASMRHNTQYVRSMGKIAAARKVQQEHRRIEDENFGQPSKESEREEEEQANVVQTNESEGQNQQNKEDSKANTAAKKKLAIFEDDEEEERSMLKMFLPTSFGGNKSAKQKAPEKPKQKPAATLKFGKIGSSQPTSHTKVDEDDASDDDQEKLPQNFRPVKVQSFAGPPRPPHLAREARGESVLVGPPRPAFIPRSGSDDETPAEKEKGEDRSESTATAAMHGPNKSNTIPTEEENEEDFVGPKFSEIPENSSSDEDEEDEKDDSNEGQIFEQRKPATSNIEKAKFFGDDEDDDEEADSEPQPLPMKNEAIIRGHEKAISAMALDPSGSRLITGSFDYFIKFYDFNGMDQRMNAFRSIEPSSGHQIFDLDYSPSGDRLLVTLSSSQPKIYDRDGFHLADFVKGDQYLYDMAQTKGHIATVVSGKWHPTEHDTILTASKDATLRLWDANNEKRHKQLIKVNQKGLKVALSSASWARQGSLILCGNDSGHIQGWPKNGPYQKPTFELPSAHAAGGITSVKMSVDGNTIISRGADSTLKVWDIRRAKTAMEVFDNLPNFYDMTDCIFSPDDKYIITGTSVKKTNDSGLLVFFDKTTLKKTYQYGIAENTSVIKMLWHPKINQIIVGSSKGQTHVFYDPELSHNGAKLCAARKVRKADPSDEIQEFIRPIVNPHAILKPEPSRKRQRLKDRMDPAKSKIPENSIQGPGVGGRLGSSLTQFIMKDIMKPIDRDIDPRDALLKYAEAAKNNPVFTKAYEKTQPKPVFDYSEYEENEDEESKQA